jgi:hypothetical protein
MSKSSTATQTSESEATCCGEAIPEDASFQEVLTRLTFFWLRRYYFRRAAPITGCGERLLLVVGAPFIFAADLLVTVAWWLSVFVAYLLTGLAFAVSCGFACIPLASRKKGTWPIFAFSFAIVASALFGAIFGFLFALLGVGCMVLLNYQGAFKPRATSTAEFERV